MRGRCSAGQRVLAAVVIRWGHSIVQKRDENGRDERREESSDGQIRRKEKRREMKRKEKRSEMIREDKKREVYWREEKRIKKKRVVLMESPKESRWMSIGRSLEVKEDPQTSGEEEEEEEEEWYLLHLVSICYSFTFFGIFHFIYISFSIFLFLYGATSIFLRRLALAETFCLNCGILALDEPTTKSVIFLFIVFVFFFL